MANHASHASLPWIIKGARYTLLVPYLDSDGDPTDPTTPDTEVSQDGGAFADCTEEVTTITGSNGMGYITLTGDETNATLVAVAAKVASGPKNTLFTAATRVLPTLRSGTAQAGAAGTITLDSGASAVDDFYNGCIVKTTGGTGGGGGSGSPGNQARIITDYVGSTKVATIEPNWETNPDSTTTFAVLLTDLAVNIVRDDSLKPTTAGRTLDVSATGEAGLDWANVGSQSTSVNLSATTVNLVNTLTTYTGNTVQTGDAFARLGAPAGASVSADILVIDNLVDDLESRLGTPSNLGSGATVAANLADIEAQTDDIGTAGAGLTAVPWNASWDTEVQSEVDDALIAKGLDHLVFTSVAGTDIADDSIIAKFVSKSATADWDSFVNTTDALEALRDRGDAAWTTATGFSTHSAADVWTSGTRTLTAATNITSTGGTITVSSGGVQVYDFTTAAKALLQTEAEDAIVVHRLDELLNADSDIDGAAPPTVGSVFHELLTKTAASFTYDQTTDSLEALRDRGDAAWVTATGFSTLDAAGVRSAVGLASANLDTQLTTIDDFLDTEIAAIKAKTDLLTTFPTNFSTLSIDANGRVQIQSGITKNVALSNFEFLMVDSTDHVSGKTGLTVTATRSIDGAAFAATANSASEVANGIYKINLGASDLNGDVITFKFTATGADTRVITFRTTA